MLLANSSIATEWLVDTDRSRLSFNATQQQAEFEGVFKEFSATIKFDPEDLDNSSIAAVVEMSSVDTQYKERDDYIVMPEWFHIAKWPSANYQANEIYAEGDGWVANGELTLKGITLPVELAFQFIEDKTDNTAKFVGRARLNRLDFQVGTGDWTDTQWIGNPVNVLVDLQLSK